MLKKLALLVSVALLLSYCTNLKDNPTQPVQEPPQEQGSVTLSLDMSAAPQNVANVKGFLARAEEDTIFFTFEIRGDKAVAQVENILPGEWYLQVDACDAQGNVLYTGNTRVTVEAGKIIPVYLQLNPVTGGVIIYVTWGEESLVQHIIAYFPFDSTLKDFSHFHNDARPYGTAHFAPGIKGQAAEFNGDANFLVIPHLDVYSLDEKTVSFWFYKNNDRIEDTPRLDDVEGLIFKAPDTGLDRDFTFSLGEQNPPFNFGFTIYNNSDSLVVLKAYEIIHPRNWYNVIAVFHKNSAQLYLNGELVVERQFDGQQHHNKAPILVGTEAPGTVPERFFNGKIDEFIILDIPLNAQQVMDVYQHGIKK